MRALVRPKRGERVIALEGEPPNGHARGDDAIRLSRTTLPTSERVLRRPRLNRHFEAPHVCGMGGEEVEGTHRRWDVEGEFVARWLQPTCTECTFNEHGERLLHPRWWSRHLYVIMDCRD